MIVEYVGMINIIRDKREEHEYIYKVFNCNDTNYSIFFIYYKHLFNVNLDYLKIRITSILIRKIVDKGMIYNKQECE